MYADSGQFDGARIQIEWDGELEAGDRCLLDTILGREAKLLANFL